MAQSLNNKHTIPIPPIREIGENQYLNGRMPESQMEQSASSPRLGAREEEGAAVRRPPQTAPRFKQSRQTAPPVCIFRDDYK